MTRIPWAIWTPALYDPVYPIKYGYYPISTRPLSVVKYVVNHDGEGWANYLSQGQRPGEQASWAFSNLLDGKLLQHYELECPTWTSGTMQANIEGVGVEHEGTAALYPKFSNAQAETDVRLYESLKQLCPNLQAPIHTQGIRIHREVSPGTTSCPNNRDRYDKYEALVAGGDELASAEAEALQAQITEQEAQIVTNRQLIEDLHSRLRLLETGDGSHKHKAGG